MSILTAPKKTEKRERQKKPDELLASVVRETAVPAAVELLRSNAPFVFPSGTAWAILVLAADRIGGLSRKQCRDEAKGSLIELIEADSICTLATADMLSEEVFGIIPTVETLARMEEYSLLTAPTAADGKTPLYSWAVVYQDQHGLQVDLVADATFAMALGVSTGSIALKDAVGREAWAAHSGETDDELTVEGDVELARIEDGADAEDEGDPLFEGVSDIDADFDEEPAFGDAFGEIADEEAEAPAFEEYTDAKGEEEDNQREHAVMFDEEDEDGGDVSQGSAETASVDDEPVADQEQVRSTIARRFLSEDLDLEVRLDEFATSFGVAAPTVQIVVPDAASSWLGDQIAQLTRHANAQLAKLHADGEAELQTEFVNLMSLHAEQVMRDVAIDRDGSVYKELTTGAKAEYREELAAKEEKGRQAQAEIAKGFEAAIAQVGQQAASQAEVQYRERNKAKIQREQLEAVAAIEAKIENDYAHTQQEILKLRRKDAERRMAIGTTRIFSVLAERQQENLAAERALMVELTNEIQRIIDENRKSDITRAEALAEEQSRFDRVAALEQEHLTIVERLRSEHANRLRRTEDEFEEARLAAIEQMRAREEEWQNSLSREKEKTDAQSKRVTDLLKQMSRMGKSFKKEYDKRITDLQAERQAYINDLERSNQMQMRSSRLTTVLMVAMSLFMAAAGFIAGALLH
ncbi:hypothetical protein [Arthrobacter bambusae]|uniref:Uncharacterized protein n=1 Tax=Arthrobacter bambusae TaxID=1338426 RepID=A0AAW8DHW6_9MICC|nr:hypothetical protein [Arthrobacter bambusae]MDP9904769.1 hypothetical protein [Arthrobacter bambusae]MDQ0129585.1 hypothetical protein [Arthrobacter bambusae]MDQ0180802.1 hypothetical protein [Arthrobacter bambusae]